MTTGKKLNRDKIMHVRAENICGALEISKKVRGKLNHIVPITYEQYMTGVDQKYSRPGYNQQR